MEDTLIEIKNNLQGKNSRVEEANNQIKDMEHKEAKLNKSEQEEERRIKKNEKSIISLWNNFKRLYLIHRNKHREAAKMRRQRNMAQMEEQIKIPEK